MSPGLALPFPTALLGLDTAVVVGHVLTQLDLVLWLSPLVLEGCLHGARGGVVGGAQDFPWVIPMGVCLPSLGEFCFSGRHSKRHVRQWPSVRHGLGKVKPGGGPRRAGAHMQVPEEPTWGSGREQWGHFWQLLLWVEGEAIQKLPRAKRWGQTPGLHLWSHPIGHFAADWTPESFLGLRVTFTPCPTLNLFYKLCR